MNKCDLQEVRHQAFQKFQSIKTLPAEIHYPLSSVHGFHEYFEFPLGFFNKSKFRFKRTVFCEHSAVKYSLDLNGEFICSCLSTDTDDKSKWMQDKWNECKNNIRKLETEAKCNTIMRALSE